MKRILTRIAAVVLTLVSLTGAAFAQTGPIGPGTAPAAPVPSIPASAAVMTPENVVSILTKLGHQASLVKHNNNAVTVNATITKDNWRFAVEMYFSPNGKNLDFAIPVGNPTSQFSSAQLMEILKKNFELGPVVHFSFRPSDNRLILEDPLYGTTGLTEQQLIQTLDRLMKFARDTHSTWDTSRWPLNGSTPTASTSGPAVTPVPTLSGLPAQPVVVPPPPGFASSK